MTKLRSTYIGSYASTMLMTIKKKWYEHIPERVSENDEATILWDIIHTDRGIKTNRTDVVREICFLMDILIPTGDNISLFKKKNFKIQISCNIDGLNFTFIDSSAVLLLLIQCLLVNSLKLLLTTMTKCFFILCSNSLSSEIFAFEVHQNSHQVCSKKSLNNLR